MVTNNDKKRVATPTFPVVQDVPSQQRQQRRVVEPVVDRRAFKDVEDAVREQDFRVPVRLARAAPELQEVRLVRGQRDEQCAADKSVHPLLALAAVASPPGVAHAVLRARVRVRAQQDGAGEEKEAE
jgi:hypothetical protein